MSELVYRLKEVTKAYQGRLVLQIDRLEIAQGEVFALVGPSGAGKTTLLRLLNFIEAPTGGEIRFFGSRIRADQDVPIKTRRRVTTVFQRPMLLNRNVRDNVSFGLRLRREPAVSRKTQAALEIVGLSHLAGESSQALSGGEAQRVALARAIVLNPDVLLLDEPTANLDPYNVGLIEEVMRKLNREGHTALVLVTHNVFQARRLATRVGLLLDGRLVEVAETKRFFQSPDDARTGAFVRGEMVY